jgi:phosphatidylglycerol:prolipoprotein diacylglycerol transferase
MILALIIGRIGCFSMGIYEDVYGIPTNFLTGMNLGDGIKRHPLMLYEMAYLILLWISIKRGEKHYQLANGAKFKLFMIGYLLFRLCIEFLKAREIYFLGLGAIQLACLSCLLYYWKYIRWPKRLLLEPISSFKS